MTTEDLLQPTLHVEVLVTGREHPSHVLSEIRSGVADRLKDELVSVKIGEEIKLFDEIAQGQHIESIQVVDYTGRENSAHIYNLNNVQLDIQPYTLHNETGHRRAIQQQDEGATGQTRVLALPNTILHAAWNSLVFEDALPARLLRYLVRMVGMMSQPSLNLSTFNWNRVCLLHGPAGSGKSTLCRALAQKLSIRLGHLYETSTMMEINANAMLSKYFGESGKIISATFDGVVGMAQDRGRFVCVVMDEVETVAGCRDKSASGSECRDGLRATNQLLTALDRLRDLPNVLVLCTSNLMEAIDPAFLDRVDIKQLVPSPSTAAIYNIFRSCINELIKSSLIDATTSTSSTSPTSHEASSQPSSPFSWDQWVPVSTAMIPTFAEMQVRRLDQLDSASLSSPGSRLWEIAQKCEGFSGRTLRRLPLQGLAMFTYGRVCSVDDAVSALEAAVAQELAGAQCGRG